MDESSGCLWKSCDRVRDRNDRSERENRQERRLPGEIPPRGQSTYSHRIREGENAERLAKQKEQKAEGKYQTRQQTRSNRDRETSRGGGLPTSKDTQVVSRKGFWRTKKEIAQIPITSKGPKVPPSIPGMGPRTPERRPETAHLTAKEPERRRQRWKVLEYEPSDHPVKGPQARPQSNPPEPRR